MPRVEWKIALRPPTHEALRCSEKPLTSPSAPRSLGARVPRASALSSLDKSRLRCTTYPGREVGPQELLPKQVPHPPISTMLFNAANLGT